LILVSGTFAYDTIGRHGPGPTTRNVKLDTLATGFGGCAGNLAGALRRLGRDPVPVAAVGLDDWAAYREHLRDLEIDESGIVVIPDEACARGFVFTAPDGAQFTAFHPGPQHPQRLLERLQRLLDQNQATALVIAPDQPEVLAAIAVCARRWRRAQPAARIVWCPGQYAGHLGAALASELAQTSDLVILNHHEHAELTTALNGSRTVVVTDGPRPVVIYTNGAVETVYVPPTAAIDPTGCGDAFSAAYIDAWLADAAPRECAQAGIRLAASCLGHRGAQGYLIKA
jgi:adenosine kinase